MVNGQDLWGIVHQMTVTFDGGKYITVCGLTEPLRKAEDEVDCVRCHLESERRAWLRERRRREDREGTKG